MTIIDPHSHAGSIRSGGTRSPIGFAVDGRPDWDVGPTGLLDLVFEPYLHGLLCSAGWADSTPFDRPFSELPATARFEVLASARDAIDSCDRGGLVRALKLAANDLYGADFAAALCDPDTFAELDTRVTRAYADGFVGRCSAIYDRLGLEYAIRPVHLDYYRSSLPPSDPRNRPIPRIDDVIGQPVPKGASPWNHGDPARPVTLDALEESARDALCYASDPAAGSRAIKTSIAYSRSLDFPIVTRLHALRALDSYRRTSDRRPPEVVQAYLIHYLLERADDVGLAFQVHTGMATLADSDPAHLEPLIRRYPNVRFVLLHTVPFERNAAYLARRYRNVYLDAAWLALLSPGVFARTIELWIDFVPTNKIMVSSDATHPEQAYGAWRIMLEELDRYPDEVVRALCAGNARALYA